MPTTKSIFKGLLETESLKNPLLVNTLALKDMKIEYHADSIDSKYWHVCKIEVPKWQIETLANQLSQEMKQGWYAIFWNNNEIITVFREKIFRMPRRDYYKSAEYKNMKEYGLANGVQEKYLRLQIN